MKIWWLANIFWLISFAVVAIIVGTRNVDGAGIVQTPEIRIITFIILGVAFVFILLIQLIWFYFARKYANDK